MSPESKQSATNPYEGYFASRDRMEQIDAVAVTKEADALGRENPIFKSIFEDEALQFLQTEQSDFFAARFNGKRDVDGYLLDTNGNSTNFLPSQNITMGIEVVSKEALNKFRNACK
jgi:hypothetical protein